MAANSSWPLRLRGSLSYLDGGSVNGDFEEWIIAILELENIEGSILVEFKDGIMEQAGVTMETEFSETITLWVNPSVNEYYQVTKFDNY